MITLPRRSVTRFFIPLIDVLILLFCIYLLMPMVEPEEGGQPGTPGIPLASEERLELDRLRKQSRLWQDLEKLRRQRADLLRQLLALRKDKLETLQQRLAIRVLEISDDGKLYGYDPTRERNRRIEITADNVAELLERQRREADHLEPYILILYPRPESGFPVYPLRSQREEYERWFADVAHGYDIPLRAP
jgi:hypothetical protein